MAYPDDRECPICEHEKLVSPREAKAVFKTSTWGTDELLENPDASVVCSWCRAIQIGGEWDRLMSTGERAYELSQVSDTVSATEYEERLGAGELDVQRGGRSSSGSSTPRGEVEPTGGEW